MNVILCENIENLGVMGDRVSVADGYARNFLIPRKLAVPVDTASAKQIQHELGIIKRREEKRRTEMTAVADQMRGLTLEFHMRAGEEDRIFGSVTAQMIAEKLAEAGHAVGKKSVLLQEPIKALGIFTVSVKLFPGVETEVKVWVMGLENEVTTSEAEAEEEDDEDDDEDDDDDEF
ncbi:MAG TPA: 50S ribosomal protein L9 [Candidatus Hydrogenedentes bacterium]|nr:50S ribosomal protein L9 [Candidatus Hydrogenedentota bacterium]HPA41979.1 50S ribosomal protein L9 [Candidatus Hydrogenedentota bacterium]HQL93145.1 50S ribosomal protein L9 [Candidatus Hydrogenedentota bacterium]